MRADASTMPSPALLLAAYGVAGAVGVVSRSGNSEPACTPYASLELTKITRGRRPSGCARIASTSRAVPHHVGVVRLERQFRRARDESLCGEMEDHVGFARRDGTQDAVSIAEVEVEIDRLVPHDRRRAPHSQRRSRARVTPGRGGVRQKPLPPVTSARITRVRTMRAASCRLAPSAPRVARTWWTAPNRARVSLWTDRRSRDRLPPDA